MVKNPHRRRDQFWTRQEHLCAFALYCRLPFGKLHKGNEHIQELALALGRTPGSVALKLCNFARLDPALQKRGIKGMSHGSKGEVEIWQDFIATPENMVVECEVAYQELLPSKRFEFPIPELSLPPTTERDAQIVARVGQSFFRRRVLAAYEFRCCVTGLSLPQLLNASHIIPWSEDKHNRLNVRNGLCLNLLHDRLFDRAQMWIDEKMCVQFNRNVLEAARKDDNALGWVFEFKGQRIKTMREFLPDPDLLAKHRERAMASERTWEEVP